MLLLHIISYMHFHPHTHIQHTHAYTTPLPLISTILVIYLIILIFLNVPTKGTVAPILMWLSLGQGRGCMRADAEAGWVIVGGT